MSDKVVVSLDGGELSVERHNKKDFSDEDKVIIQETMNKTVNGLMWMMAQEIHNKIQLLEDNINEALGLNDDDSE